jgi:hypothetical protein
VDSDAAEGRGAEGDSSGRGDWCRTERAQLRTRERAFRERATPAWREVEARAAGPATQRGTICHCSHGRSGACHGRRRVTAPGHWATPAAITAPVTAITVTGSGQQARFPRRRRPPGQRLPPGRAGGTKLYRETWTDLSCWRSGGRGPYKIVPKIEFNRCTPSQARKGVLEDRARASSETVPTWSPHVSRLPPGIGRRCGC